MFLQIRHRTSFKKKEGSFAFLTIWRARDTANCSLVIWRRHQHQRLRQVVAKQAQTINCFTTQVKQPCQQPHRTTRIGHCLRTSATHARPCFDRIASNRIIDTRARVYCLRMGAKRASNATHLHQTLEVVELQIALSGLR